MRKINFFILFISAVFFSCQGGDGSAAFDLEIMDLGQNAWVRVADLPEDALTEGHYSSSVDELEQMSLKLTNLTDDALFITRIVGENEYIVIEADYSSALFPGESLQLTVQGPSYEILCKSWVKVNYQSLSGDSDDFFIIELNNYWGYSYIDETSKITGALSLGEGEFLSLQAAFGFTGPFHHNVEPKGGAQNFAVVSQNNNYNIRYTDRDVYLYGVQPGTATLRVFCNGYRNEPTEIQVEVIARMPVAPSANEPAIRYFTGGNRRVLTIPAKKGHEYLLKKAQYFVALKSGDMFPLVESHQHVRYELYDAAGSRLNGNLLSSTPVYSIVPDATASYEIRLDTWSTNLWACLSYRELPLLKSLQVTQDTVEVASGSAASVDVVFSPSDIYQAEYDIIENGIAAVDQSGQIFGGVPGTSTMTVRSASNSNLYDRVSITVIPSVLQLNRLTRGYLYVSHAASTKAVYRFTAGTAGNYSITLEDRDSQMNGATASADMTVMDGSNNPVATAVAASVTDPVSISMTAGETATISVSSRSANTALSYFNIRVSEGK